MAILLLIGLRVIAGFCFQTKPAQQKADVVPVEWLSFVVSLIVSKVRLRPLKCTGFIMYTAVSMLNSILIHKAITI
jgi:hypothetical protein